MNDAFKKRFTCLQLAVVIAVGFPPVARPSNYIDHQTTTYLKPGSWGGQGISLVVEKNSAAIELDCAKGAISSRVKIRNGGTFAATGSLTRSGPGPIRLDSPPKGQPVRFEGKITKKQMRLKIILVDTDEVMGTYILERDTQGELVRCY